MKQFFYEAFRHCDSRVMAALWAEGDVVCIHPGSGAILGYDAVVRSWEHIFSGGGEADLQYSVIRESVADDIVVHLLTEEITTEGDTAMVLATNVYQKFDQGWLMVEHHGSLVQSRSHEQTLQ